jgi:hypothetical protein
LSGVFSPGRPLAIVLSFVLLLAGGITVFSLQSSQNSGSMPEVQADPTPNPGKASKGKLVTRNPQGDVVVVDRDSGDVRALTPAESKRLAQGLKQLVNNSSEGLVQIRHKDGAISMDLEGRFQNVVLARVEDDGSVSTSCIDNLEAAAAFFQIDPTLLGVVPRPVSQDREKWPTK